MGILEKRKDLVATAVRVALGWHLAYLGVWAVTSTWDYSWTGCFRCAHWLFGGALRAIGHSAAMGVVDFVIAWALLVAGILLMLGKAVRCSAVFGIIYFALMYQPAALRAHGREPFHVHRPQRGGDFHASVRDCVEKVRGNGRRGGGNGRRGGE